MWRPGPVGQPRSEASMAPDKKVQNKPEVGAELRRTRKLSGGIDLPVPTHSPPRRVLAKSAGHHGGARRQRRVLGQAISAPKQSTAASQLHTLVQLPGRDRL